MSDDKKKLYRAWLSFNERGASIWCSCGIASPCGQWVDVGDIRHRRTDEWHETQAAAKAAHAEAVADMAVKMLQQANDLTAAKEAADA